jgi:hypothetical protein
MLRAPSISRRFFVRVQRVLMVHETVRTMAELPIDSIGVDGMRTAPGLPPHRKQNAYAMELDGT